MLFQVITENGQKKIQPLTADTGTGAPVGSIIVVCSNILPSGYLGLGVQYDITNYPALYQVLGTDTTPTASALGLPTLSSGQYAIKATSGLTENQQENVLNTINENLSYSTEEHPTGKKWIDGKPIYSKSFSIAIANFPYSTGITNVDNVAKIEAVGIDQGNNFYTIPFSTVIEGVPYVRNVYFKKESGILYSDGNTSPVSITVTLEYTKTTN